MLQRKVFVTFTGVHCSLSARFWALNDTCRRIIQQDVQEANIQHDAGINLPELHYFALYQESKLLDIRKCFPASIMFDISVL